MARKMPASVKAYFAALKKKSPSTRRKQHTGSALERKIAAAFKLNFGITHLPAKYKRVAADAVQDTFSRWGWDTSCSEDAIVAVCRALTGRRWPMNKTPKHEAQAVMSAFYRNGLAEGFKFSEGWA